MGRDVKKFSRNATSNNDNVKYFVYRYKSKFNTTSVARPIPNLISKQFTDFKDMV